MSTPRTMIVLSCLAACLLSGPKRQTGAVSTQKGDKKAKPTEIKIDGYVVDRAGNALEGVQVFVQQSGMLKKDKTDKTGYYKISAKEGSSFTLVFIHSDVGRIAVSHLSGHQDHKQHINKVLLEDKDLKTALDMQERLASIETVLLMAKLYTDEVGFAKLVKAKATINYLGKLEKHRLDTPKDVSVHLSGKIRALIKLSGGK